MTAARTEPLSIHEPLLTIKEVAAEYRVREETVRFWIKSKVIPAELVGLKIKVRRSDIEKAVVPRHPRTTPVETQETPYVRPVEAQTQPRKEETQPPDHPSGSDGGDAPEPIGDDPPARPRKRGGRPRRRLYAD